MRSRFFAVLGFAGILTIGACSASTEEKPKAQTNGAAVVSNSSNSAPAVAAGSNTNVTSDGMVVSPQNVDPNAPATASSDAVVPPDVHGRFEKMRQAGNPTGNSPDPLALAMKNAKPAPDNSTFTSYLSDAGYEIRTFNNHPQLLKVEKKVPGNGEQTLKVFLRNGQVIELPGQKIAMLSTASAASIVEAAGLSAAPTKQAASNLTGAKKQH